MNRLKFLLSIALFVNSVSASLGNAVDDGGHAASNESSVASLSSSNLRHLFQVASFVFSGAAPEGEAAFAEIARRGVKTIISVDGGKPDVEAARKQGLRYVHLPFGYDGVPVHRVAELAKAAQSADGPVYVHCHHGLHRGPVAVAVMCQATSGWTTNQAVTWLKRAGTSLDYAGLYRSVLEFRAPSASDLARVIELPETTQPSSITESMVAIDESFNQLKAARKTGWAKVSDKPHPTPTEAAVILWEQFRECARTESTAKRPEDYRSKLAAAVKSSDTLRALLSGRDANIAQKDDAFKALEKTCAACHKTHRN